MEHFHRIFRALSSRTFSSSRPDAIHETGHVYDWKFQELFSSLGANLTKMYLSFVALIGLIKVFQIIFILLLVTKMNMYGN
jgi:hypothetical protein